MLVDDEVVRALGLDVPALQGLSRKVTQVRRDDDLGARPDRRGQDMPVVRVGELQRPDQWLVAGDQAVPDRGEHELA